VDGVELIAYVRDSHRQTVNLKFSDGTGRNLVFSRRTHKTHSPAPSSESHLGLPL